MKLLTLPSKINLLPEQEAEYVIYVAVLFLYLCTTMLNSFSFLATAKPGRVVGPVLHYEDERITKSSNDPRIVIQNTTQAVSSRDAFQTHPPNTKTTSGIHKEQGKNEFPSLQSNLHATATTDLNNNPYRRRVINNNLNDPVTTIDAKMLQAQSHLGVVGAAAVAVATHSHRYSRGIQYGLF